MKTNKDVQLDVSGAVDRAVFRIVDWAVFTAPRIDPAHPAIADFLASPGAEAP